MLGLMIKDWKTILHATKFYLIAIVCFAIIPMKSISWYCMFLAAMLPITAVGYDERAGWNAYARMLPYTEFEIVFSRYVFSYIMIGGTFLLMLVGYVLSPILHTEEVGSYGISYTLLMVCVSLCLIAIDMPIMLHFGLEKARMILIIISVVVMIGSGNLLTNNTFAENNEMLYTGVGVGMAALLSVVLQILSVGASFFLYRRSEKC